MTHTLDEWLDYQQQIHPRSVELGLDRVGAVWRRLGTPSPAPVVITVGGTNGKGSTVAFLEAMLDSGCKRVGAFTSPHLLRYNERVRVLRREVDDAVLVTAFERIEAARGEIPLTYFEFNALAALLVFADTELDVALLEVGLGGRLDAVNLVDADAAIITTIDLDHQEWLGADRDAIGREKAGILRRGRPAIVGDPDPPAGLIDAAIERGAKLRIAGRDFHSVAQGAGWRWQGWPTAQADGCEAPPEAIVLPEPGLAAPCQIGNASAAIAALFALRDRLRWNPAAIVEGVRDANVAARLQRFAGPVELIVDVAHNPQAARSLAAWLAAHPIPGRTHAVFGALADKDVEAILAAFDGQVDAWHLGGLEGESPRGLNVAALEQRFPASVKGSVVSRHADLESALHGAFDGAVAGDRVVAFGSFFVAAAALRHNQRDHLVQLDPASSSPMP